MNMESWSGNRQKVAVLVALVVTTTFGACLRLYHFPDLVFFEIDQARDYRLIAELLQNGVADFPLLGPKAGGTLFRLGSLYYVPSYLLALAFDITPYLTVLPEMLLSIAMVPLSYVFLNEFFSRRISMYLSALVASSLFLVEYAHFSWNPNVIPFFLILLAYAALRYSRESYPGRKTAWSIVAAVALGVGMQLHTIAFVGMPLIMTVYLPSVRSHVRFKDILVSLFIIFIFFSPWMANDALTNGENSRAFLKAVVSRSEQDERDSLGKHLFMDTYNSIRFYSLVLTSHNQVRELGRVASSRDVHDLIRKNLSDTHMRESLARAAAVGMLLCASFVLMLRECFMLKPDETKEGERKANFLRIVLITQIVFFVIYYPLANEMDSRLFLPVTIIPVVMIGIFLNYFDRIPRFGKMIAFTLFAALFALNIKATVRWLSYVGGYGNTGYKKGGEYILEPYFVVTLGQWEHIMDEVASKIEGFTGVIYIQSTPYHIRPFTYLLEIEKGLSVRQIDVEKLDPKGMYFVLREAVDYETDDPIPENLGRNFDVKSIDDFGSVLLIGLQIKKEVLNSLPDVSEPLSFEQPNCYDLHIDIEFREKCRVRDIPALFRRQ
jgi:4-amino-4-deoxy-L-arabinose transferase-like glycosyltransferase